MTQSEIEFIPEDFDFLSYAFIGRVLFSSFFILSALYEYTDVGRDATVQRLLPEYDIYSNYEYTLATPAEKVEEMFKKFVEILRFLKICGGFLFLFTCTTLGAKILLFHQQIANSMLYNYKQNIALCGALIFYIEMCNQMPNFWEMLEIWDPSEITKEEAAAAAKKEKRKMKKKRKRKNKSVNACVMM
ncbi:hypothetical protein ACFE04_030020 [Oxalis oulophora]